MAEVESSAGSSRRFQSHHSFTETTAEIVLREPLQQLQKQIKEALSIADFWADMSRRERTGFHKGSVVVAFMQLIVGVAYCLAMISRPPGKVDYLYINFIAWDVFIAAVAQFLFSVRGVCLENFASLLIGNINSVATLARIGLTIQIGLEHVEIDASITGVYAALALAFSACSFVAWGGGFQRFMMFQIGPDESVQRMFRAYQMCLSVGALDLQFMAMSVVALLFTAETRWWHFVVVLVLGLSNVVGRLSLRVVLREERPFPIVLIVAPLYLSFTVVVLLGLYAPSVMTASIPSDFNSSVALTVALHVVVRAAFWVLLLRCMNNFGHGMSQAFDQQKTATEFLLSQKKARERFLQESVPLVAP
jgi:hypothetical protein